MDIDQHMKERYEAIPLPNHGGWCFTVYESRHARYIVEDHINGKFTIYGYIGNFAENVKEQK